MAQTSTFCRQKYLYKSRNNAWQAHPSIFFAKTFYCIPLFVLPPRQDAGLALWWSGLPLSYFEHVRSRCDQSAASCWLRFPFPPLGLFFWKRRFSQGALGGFAVVHTLGERVAIVCQRCSFKRAPRHGAAEEAGEEQRALCSPTLKDHGWHGLSRIRNVDQRALPLPSTQVSSSFVDGCGDSPPV